jgi:hypothetical protein
VAATARLARSWGTSVSPRTKWVSWGGGCEAKVS